MNCYQHTNHCRTHQSQHNRQINNNNINTNTLYLNHNNKKIQHSFKFEYITIATFLSRNTNNTNQYYSNRLFLGNHVSTSIKLHFQKKYNSRHYKHGNGAIQIPDDLYQEIISLKSQMLNLLKYEYNNHNNNTKNKTNIIDIHIVYLQNIECLGILIYYEHNKYDNNALSIFNKYFNVIEYIDNQCHKYWECIKCKHQLNKVKNVRESIFFCDKCKFDFTFHHNPNNHYCISFNKQYNSIANNNNNKKLRSCIKYKFLPFKQFNANNITTMNLYKEMSHEDFQQLTNTKFENEEIEINQNENVSNDWTDQLLLSNLEKWFGHKSGTKIGLNDYKFDIGKNDTFEDTINNMRCRDSEGERHGVDHNCIACKPWLISNENEQEWEYNEEYEINKKNKTIHFNSKKSWLCSLCQKTIPIDIKTCICVTYDNKNNKNKQNNNNKIVINNYTTYENNVNNNNNNGKDCLIVIKELAETLHSTISFNEIPQEFKTSSKPFEYEICFNGEIIANGYGNSKRKAQRNGAEIALEFLSKDKGYERKINLLQKFGRIGQCEIDRNLYVEICRDISDENNIYSVIPLNIIEYNTYEYENNLFVYDENNNNIMKYLEKKIIKDISPQIIAYKTRVTQISHLDEPSVLGCLDVTGPLKFSLVSGIFHKDVNNGRYGYNYNPKHHRNKKKKKRKKRRRNNNNTKLVDKSVSTINVINNKINRSNYNNQRNFSHPSKYEYHEIYCNNNSPQLYKHSKRRRRKKERERERKKKEDNMHGVYICNECDKYYADNLNGKYLYELKWFCFNCIKIINERNHSNNLNSFMESAIYTKRTIKNKNKLNELTPPMTPPSSDDENNLLNNNNKQQMLFDENCINNYYKNEEEFLTEIIDNISLFGPHTPTSPSLTDKKTKKKENDNSGNEKKENDYKCNEKIKKNVQTVSVATQVNSYNYNNVNKAIQVTAEQKDNETKPTTESLSPQLIIDDQFNNYDSIITNQSKIYNHNKHTKNLKTQYKEKYINNVRVNDDYDYIHNVYPHQHQSQILYSATPTYNIQNSWEAYYGQSHRNMLFIDPYQSVNSIHTRNDDYNHHLHTRHTYHTQRQNHHHTNVQTTNRQHIHVTGMDAYSNMNPM